MLILKKKFQLFKKYSSILELAIIQGANAIFPVLVFPFMLVKLGGDVFSHIALSEALALYVLIFSMYSFDIISVQKVVSSLTRNDEFKVYIITLICRVILFIVSGSLIVLLTYLFNDRLTLFLLAFLLYPLGMILQSNYFFQATSSNRPLAIFVVITRGLSLLMIYLYSPSNRTVDSFYYVLCVSGSYFLSGLFATVLIFYRNRGNKILITYAEVLNYIKNGYHLFVANIFVILYRNSNVIILGLLASPMATSIYSTAEKVIKSVQAIATPLNQFYFTNLLKKHGEKKEGYKPGEYKSLIYSATKLQLKVMTFIVIALVVCGYVLFCFVENIGEIRAAIVPILIMSVAILLGVCNFMFGSVGLSILGLKKEFSYVTGITGILTISFSLLLSHVFYEVGAAMAYVLAEFILLILILKIYKLRKL